MDQTTNQIEQHIRVTRDNLSENFNELGEKVRTAVDWRSQFEQRPGTMLALAFGGGVLLSALLPAGRRKYEGYSTPRGRWANPADSNCENFSSREIKEQTTGTRNPDASNDWRLLRGALVGLATTRLTDVLESLLPGFQKEFARARSAKAYNRSDDAQAGSRSNWQRSAMGAEAD